MFCFRFRVESKHAAFYTGGNVEWFENKLYAQTYSEICLLDVETGTVLSKVGEENHEDADIIHTFTTNGHNIVTSHKSGLLKLWNSNYELEKMWKYIHKGPIAKLSLNGDDLASGGSDGSVRIWDLVHQACKLNLKGCQGVVNVVEFYPETGLLFASGDDGKINSWQIDNGSLQVIYNGHFSKVTSISFHVDQEHFVSSARDKVLILWKFGSSAGLRTIPVYEAVETVICLPFKFKIPNFKATDGIHVAIAGENGVIRVWDVGKSKEIYVQNNSLVSKAKEEGGLAVAKLLLNTSLKCFGVVSAEHNIILHDMRSFDCIKQFVGFSDEILDISFLGANDSYLAVATNSTDIKLYENKNMNCQLLKGHTDIVLSLNKSMTNPNLLASSSKDNTIRLWLLSDGSVSCVGIGRRHTGSVGSVAFSQMTSKFLVSVSQDTCIKIWEVPTEFKENENLSCNGTEIGHQKDINSVTVAPNDKIIGTASQDKTAKLWNESLEQIGVLRGHRRGVWNIRFSPVDQVVLTSSADCTIKIWSILDLNCLKTLESHDSSVIRAEFISKGMQILSAGADGLIKLFDLRSSECTKTFEEHEARVWTLAVNADESGFATGGSDSKLIKWKDVTHELKLERSKKLEELILQEQQLSNYLQSNQLLKALKLALKLNRPTQVLQIVQEVIKKGDTGLSDAISELKEYQKEDLLKCASKWNTNSKNCQPAQLVINILLNDLQKGELKPKGFTKFLEGTLPYTERHFNRLTQLKQDIYFINYTINCMQIHAKSGL